MGRLPAGTSVPLVASALQASPANSHSVTLLPGLTNTASSPEVVREAGETRSGPTGPGLTTAQADKLIIEVFQRHSQSVEAVEAFDDLSHALMLAREKGQEVPCLGPGADAWTSEDADEQAVAADRCLDCPAMLLCKEYADLAKTNAGTWGGVTRGPSREALKRSRLAEIDERKRRRVKDRKSAGHPAVRGPLPTGRDCRCRCGEQTRGGYYRPGHDSRHLSRLLTAVRGGSLALDVALVEVAHAERLKAKLMDYLGA